MSDINKIQIIHNLKNKFEITDNILNILTNQIEESKYKDNIERFFRGYNIEDNFGKLFSEIPWVKLVHGLNQDQYPIESKEEYQVPDYNLIYETSAMTNNAILIEVKSVKGEKSTLELMSKQVESLTKYAKTQNIEILIAIFWNKVNIWTINSLEHFELKTKKLKINLLEAMKNDMSTIIGDLTYFIPKLYRKSIFDSSINDESKIQHEKYGCQVSDSISLDNKTYTELTLLESAIIDSCINVKEINKKNNNTLTTIIEESKNIYSFKISSLILRFLAMIPKDIQDDNTINLAKITIIELMKKLNINSSYMIPNRKVVVSDILFKKAFENTHVWDDYNK